MTRHLSGKTAVVTGGNSGIGKEIAAGLAELGADVVLPVRNAEKGEKAAGEIEERTGKRVELMALDLASFASVRKLADEFLRTHDALHVLVSNAGGWWSRRRETEDGHETTFQVNHLGAFLLTDLLLDRLKASAPARVVTTSSKIHYFSRGLHFDDLDRTRRPYRGMRAYIDSKLCSVLFTRELAGRVAGSGVTATCFHPGLVRTKLAQEGDTVLVSLGTRITAPFAGSPKKGAATGLYLAASPDVAGVSGEFFSKKRVARMSKSAKDDDAARRLWEVSEEMVGLTEART